MCIIGKHKMVFCIWVSFILRILYIILDILDIKHIKKWKNFMLIMLNYRLLRCIKINLDVFESDSIGIMIQLYVYCMRTIGSEK